MEILNLLQPMEMVRLKNSGKHKRRESWVHSFIHWLSLCRPFSDNISGTMLNRYLCM